MSDEEPCSWRASKDWHDTAFVLMHKMPVDPNKSPRLSLHVLATNEKLFVPQWMTYWPTSPNPTRRDQLVYFVHESVSCIDLGRGYDLCAVASNR